MDILTAAKSFEPQLAQNAVGAFINGSSEIADIRQVLSDQDKIKIISIPSKESLEVVRHSAAHVLAQAVQELWPQTKVTIGPVIEDGFYYDFDCEKPFNEEDLTRIEKKMREIIKRKLKITKEIWPSKKAIETFKKMGESYKVELIEEINAPEVSIYRQGDWFDLCRGPHLQHLGQIGAVKVLSHSAAYWRGDEGRQSLQRIYGTAFHTSKDLKNHLVLIEQAKKRDHRKIGKEMGIFYFSDKAAGQPFFKAPGVVIYRELKNFLRTKYVQHGYEEVISPQIYSKDLFTQSGHFDFYKDNMYEVQSLKGAGAFLKPMNCPGHCLLYKSQGFSYKDLPWRVADFGRLHRFEKSGTLHGLTRVRSFCQDDAHIFCAMDQLEDEIKNFLLLLKEVYAELGLEHYHCYFCTRPKKKMGSDEIWSQAEQALEKALKSMNISYKKEPEGGSFYGPKLDMVFTDSMKRSWQAGTLQCDFNLPSAFRLTYNDKNNEIKTPVLLHRAVLGSLERFIGIYLEHRAGRLPVWLAPVQAVLINVSKEQEGYLTRLYDKLRGNKNMRVKIDISTQSLGYKIRQARLLRIPYILVAGKKEEQSKMISVSSPDGKTSAVEVDVFLSKIKKEITERKVGYSSF